jgi:uncharacterized integral membrane protein
MNGKLILGLASIGLVALFIIQNAAAVSIHYLAWTLSMNGALLFFIILMLGVLAGWLLHGFVYRKKSSRKQST